MASAGCILPEVGTPSACRWAHSWEQLLNGRHRRLFGNRRIDLAFAQAHSNSMAHDLSTMVERMSVPALHEMHDSLWPLLVEASSANPQEFGELRSCASAIEAELISRSQAVARFQF